jgi:hypothetical protein
MAHWRRLKKEIWSPWTEGESGLWLLRIYKNGERIVNWRSLIERMNKLILEGEGTEKQTKGDGMAEWRRKCHGGG